jgi:hypothetical protein
MVRLVIAVTLLGFACGRALAAPGYGPPPTPSPSPSPYPATATEEHYPQVSPGYYLVTVYDDEGKTTLESGLWQVRPPDESNTSAPYAAIGYGVTARWYTKLYFQYLNSGAAGTRFSSLTWQNDYLLTQGQYPFDLALHTSIKRNRNADVGDAFEFGPALQTEFGRTQVNVNVFFERYYRGEEAARMQLKYQWQVKHRWKPAFAFGLQGFGEVGDWDHWSPRSEQSHRAGPVISGTFGEGGPHEWKYEAAWFTGKVLGERSKTLAVRVQYEF